MIQMTQKIVDFKVPCSAQNKLEYLLRFNVFIRPNYV